MTRGLRTALTARLGIKHPVIQSPMTWVSDSRLTEAASAAGALGIFASTTVAPGAVEAEILKIKATTPAPFGIYATGLQPNLEEVVDVVIRHRVRAFCYGRGVTAETLGRLKSEGIVCLTNVGAARHAVKAVELGADVIMVQGSEGGGHTGAVSTLVLLPQVLDAVSVPVVAAGGFYNGRGLAAALAAGADGIAMGTRFMMTRESRVAEAALAHYATQRDGGAIRISTAIDGLPQRVIENRLIREMETSSQLRQLMLGMRAAWAYKSAGKMSFGQFLGMALKSLKEGPVAATQTLRMARLPELLRLGLEQGDTENGLLPAGQAAAAIGEIISCDDLVQGIVRQASERLEHVQREITRDHD